MVGSHFGKVLDELLLCYFCAIIGLFLKETQRALQLIGSESKNWLMSGN